MNPIGASAEPERTENPLSACLGEEQNTNQR
jgi:hypothetical protein